MKRWELFNLDVWGNSLEGFEVNDSTLLAILDLPVDGEEITDDMVFEAVKRWLNAGIKKEEIEIEWLAENWAAINVAETGEPLFDVRLRTFAIPRLDSQITSGEEVEG